ncbi:TPA: nucleotidyltransferase domain-containing protein [Candidatus Woesearchaeota archaeon]|nr:MAG: hypothetical protein QT07_C0005G0006 [archaeon GW2011_AR16]HIG96563.1 nucleotidyltransferase domain-containing protein [Candidatus Woesearchaeota archaeon]HII88777.1 nucleotidyltransferase domain-containing protein [Candidatus Woesearchaeota archaeon]
MPKQKHQKKAITRIELTSSTLRILSWFCAYPEKEFTFNEICTATGTSKTVAKQVIEIFIKKGVIIRNILGKLWRLAVNQESEYFKQIKIVLNFQQIYLSGIANAIRKSYPQARAIILFGSYRKGDDISTSDLDIAVEIPGNLALTVENFQTCALGYREKVQVKLHLFCRQKIDPNVFANIANGIILNGFLEVRP